MAQAYLIEAVQSLVVWHLVFLPGKESIAFAHSLLRRGVDLNGRLEVFNLHGEQDPTEQSRAIRHERDWHGRGGPDCGTGLRMLTDHLLFDERDCQ